MRRNFFNSDPFWLLTKWAGKCEGCGEIIPKGSRAWYYPIGKHIYCDICGIGHERTFKSQVADDAIMAGERVNPYVGV